MRNQFDSIGSYFSAVHQAALSHGNVDPRLRPQGAPSQQSSEAGGGADGGYAAPPEVRADVTRVLLGETSLLGRTDRQIITGNSISIPVDAAPAWSTAGPQVGPEAEGTAYNQSKLALQGRTLRLNKSAVYLPVTNELLEDATGLGAYLRAAIPERINFKVSDWILNGDGIGKPLGLLKSGAKIVQTKEGAQAAGTIQAANLSKMWARLWGPSKQRAVWIAHSTVEQALQGLSLPPGLFSYTAGEPFPRLFGAPVLVSEVAQTIGTEGDLVLADLASYFTATRQEPVKEELSVHVYFDTDASAFRFTVRVAGAPWLGSTLTQFHGGATVSTIVTLEAR